MLYLALLSSSSSLSSSSFFSFPLSPSRAQSLQFDPQSFASHCCARYASFIPASAGLWKQAPWPCSVRCQEWVWLRAGMFPRWEVKGSVWTSGHLQCLTCRHVMWKEGRLPALLMAVSIYAAKHCSDHEIACQVICCEIHYEKHPETDAWLEILSLLNCRNYLWKVLSLLYFFL